MTVRDGGSFQCPQCGGGTAVKDSRPMNDSSAIRRRRHCIACHYRFTTHEMQLPEIHPVLTAQALSAMRADLADMLKRVDLHLEALERYDRLVTPNAPMARRIEAGDEKHL